MGPDPAVRRERLRVAREIAAAQMQAVDAVEAAKGAADGYAELDGAGKVPLAQLPSMPATGVTIDGSGFVGSLMGSGITTVQELANWLDANL